MDLLDYKIDLNIMKFIVKKLGIYFTTEELINLYKNNKIRFKKFKLLRIKIDNKIPYFHHPSKTKYKLNI